jgi:hypothetical protein
VGKGKCLKTPISALDSVGKISPVRVGIYAGQIRQPCFSARGTHNIRRNFIEVLGYCVIVHERVYSNMIEDLS